MTSAPGRFALALVLAGVLSAWPAIPQARQSRPEWITRAVSAPGVEQRTFMSAAAGTEVSYHIYRPPSYDEQPERRFPVVYWLHGSGGGLAGISDLSARYDRAIRRGLAPPALVVFVNGLAGGMYVDWKDGSRPVESVIIRDLIPHIDASWRTLPAREGRLIEGFSMGGYGAARLGFKYPDLFGAVSILGAGPMQPDLVADAPRASRLRALETLNAAYGGDRAHFLAVSPLTLAEAAAPRLSGNTIIRLAVGRSDETYANNLAFHQHLQELGVRHDWITPEGVGHDPGALLNALGADNWSFYRRVFLPGNP